MAAGIKGEGLQKDEGDCASVDEQRKRWATLRATAALAGFRLEECAGGFVVSRWGFERIFGSLDELEPWLARAGVRT